MDQKLAETICMIIYISPTSAFSLPSRSPENTIAIVGMSIKTAGADDVDEFSRSQLGGLVGRLYTVRSAMAAMATMSAIMEIKRCRVESHATAKDGEDRGGRGEDIYSQRRNRFRQYIIANSRSRLPRRDGGSMSPGYQ